MASAWKQRIVLALVAGLVFFTNLGGYGLFDEDEPKNAVCGFEMYERGDWIVPTFNAQLRTDKPILIYWWMHLSFQFLGVSEFSARLGSAVLSSLTVFLTFFVGKRLYSPSIGLLAGVVLATCLMFTAVGRAVTPDSTLISCLMFAFTSYVWAVSRRRGGHFSGTTASPVPTAREELVPANWWTAVPMFAGMGLAILAKGPIGVLLPCTIIGLFLLISSRRFDLASGAVSQPTGPWWRRGMLTVWQVMSPGRILKSGLAMRLPLGALIVCAIALPWYITVGLRTDGAWLQGFLGDHNLGRFLEPKENHSGPIFYYAIVLLMGCFPWSVFLPLSVWALRRRLRSDAAWGDSDRFLACWAGVWFVFFSFARTKLPNYVLPMYPSLALLMARYLVEWVAESSAVSQSLFRHCCRALAIVGVLMMVGLPIVASLLLPGEEFLLVVGLIPVIGGALAYRAASREQRPLAVRVVGVTAILLAVSLVGIAPSYVGTHQDSPRLAEAARRVTGQSRPALATLDAYSPSLIFYARSPVEGLRQPTDVADFLRRHPQGLIVTRADRLDRLPVADNHLVEVARCRRFLRRYDVVLLAPAQVAQLADTSRR